MVIDARHYIEPVESSLFSASGTTEVECKLLFQCYRELSHHAILRGISPLIHMSALVLISTTDTGMPMTRHATLLFRPISIAPVGERRSRSLGR